MTYNGSLNSINLRQVRIYSLRSEYIKGRGVEGACLFLIKLSKGLQSAKKAQQTVEITKFKTQISLKEREIDKIYKLIGESVYTSYLSRDYTQVEANVSDYCQGIAQINQEIAKLNRRLPRFGMKKNAYAAKWL